MLTEHDVVPYLLRRGLLSQEAAVEGGLAVFEAPGRNRNFQVTSDEAPCFFLKQGIGPEGKAAVAREAALYLSLQSEPGGLDVLRYLPRFHGYDPEERVLVLESFAEARSLGRHQTRTGRFSAALASELGDALGALHRLGRFTGGSEADLPGVLPWILSVHRPDPTLFRDVSDANLELIRIVQRSAEFRRHLDELRSDWRPEALIHYDVKWENCLVVARPNSRSPTSGHSPRRRLPRRRPTELKIVDWELARPGEPGWDLGSVFSEVLAHWLLSTPLSGRIPLRRSVELSGYPLRKMQPAIRSFWGAYVKRLEIDSGQAGERLLRAVRYSAARLVQTGYEYLQASEELPASIAAFLQLALNMLRRPQVAAAHLLGLGLQAERTT